MLKRSNLHSYQVNAVNYIKEKKKAALFLEMGMGKTATNLTAAADMLHDLEVLRVLIIAPLRVANTVWKQETQKWEHLNHLHCEIATGSIKNRNEAVLADPDILIINRENLVWLIDNHKWKYDMVIIDESTGFKNSRSKRFRALKKQIDKIKVMLPSTGTPSPQSLLDLYAQIYLIDKGDRLGKHITQFKERYFKASGYMGYDLKLKKGADDKIKKRISDISFSMKARDYLDLPKLIPPIIRSISLPGPVKKDYDELEKEFILSLKNGVDIEAPSASAVSTKLLQMCNGAVYDEDGQYHEIHKEKIDELKQIVQDNPNENMIVAYNFKHDLKRLQKAFPDAVFLDKKGVAIDKWNKGEIKMLLVHPASGGHGLNLQFGGSFIVWFGNTWNLEFHDQLNGRLDRQGQTKPVRKVYIVAEGTIDEKVIKALQSKAETQAELMEYLKYSLKLNK